MKVLTYSELEPKKITGFAKFRKAMERDDFTQVEVKKVASNLYRARLGKAARLLFSLYRYAGETWCLVLEYLPNHEYEKSRFLAGKAQIDESKLPDITPDKAEPETAIYLNQAEQRFYYLDKVLSFDEQQQQIYNAPAPLVIIGSAGSGKTALILEKLKLAAGDVLYVSQSPWLVENARNLYYGNGYRNDLQEEADFLSFREYLETIAVPQGREVTRKDFEAWFARQVTKGLTAHKIFEEFRGVLTGPSIEAPWLSREGYLDLGIRQSLYPSEERERVYDLFEKYLAFLQDSQLYDSNIVSQQYLSKAEPRYDFAVVDEVQDLTNTQLMLLLRSLREPGQFLLCGDSNQIVHPNFFSWSKVKSLFFSQDQLAMDDQVLRILQANYRNSPLVTAVANRILKLKHARFGSVDKESNYLIKSVGEHDGQLQLLADSPKVRQDLDASTARSTRFAVIVMHPEQKAAAQKVFNTPLIFSIQEAKGLEYESIILFNFVSQESRLFNDIAKGVNPEDLDVDELRYARAKNKADKSLEAYKFYINALYVAITRAVRNLYIVEADLKHRLMKLLDLERFVGELQIEKQESSKEEWQREAHKLEMQGKEEQAKNIRDSILKEQKVPWQPISRDALAELEKTAESGNKKKQLLLLEYGLLHERHASLNGLLRARFNPAIKARANKSKAIKTIYKNHFMIYDLKQPNGVLREVDKYGVDHRTRFNWTPLMTAAYIGNLPLLRILCERGADTHLLANHGLNAWQMVLSRLLLEPGKISNAGEIYQLIAPESVSVQVDGRLEKLDDRTMYGFLVNVFFALWHGYCPSRAEGGEAVTAAHLEEMLQHLPDSVLPPMKKKRAYISRYLSENEVDRETPRNKKLFVRRKRGHYLLNPCLKIRQGVTWYRLHDLLAFEGWAGLLSDYALDRLRQNNGDSPFLRRMREYQTNNRERMQEWLEGLAEAAESSAEQ